jgi:hypothetical protein
MGWIKSGFILTASLAVLAWMFGKRRTASIGVGFAAAFACKWRETQLASEVHDLLAEAEKPARTVLE